MKKNLLLFIAFFVTTAGAIKAQTVGPAQQRLLDSLCKELSKIDVSKITTKKAADDAFEKCFETHADLLTDVAKERNVDITDEAAMSEVGVAIGKNLMKQKCGSFMQLAMKMGKDDDAEDAGTQVTAGVFKRIDTKGFNYIVITDKAASEKSFIWLRQFAGSEKFMDALPAKLVGKKLKITWKDMEVYLPQAKGYYTVKEIVSIDIL
jgi:hypothetical protein